jgi:predicted regulator of Ras-like GTPase activity (Roadblock/LC7/MglB family)
VDAAATPAQLLAQLIALSAEIERAAIVDPAGVVVAATSPADGEKLARVAGELLAAAASTTAGVEHVVVDLAAGSVLAVRDDGQVAVATTSPEPPSALVLHDLRMLLRQTKGQADDA